jgi:hypothetical protein
MGLVRQHALSDAAAQRAHTALASAALGEDPASAASHYMQADLGGQSDVSQALSNATLSEAQHQRDFGQQLLFSLLNKQGPQNVYNPATGPDWLKSIAGALSGIGQYAQGAAALSGGG